MCVVKALAGAGQRPQVILTASQPIRVVTAQPQGHRCLASSCPFPAQVMEKIVTGSLACCSVCPSMKLTEIVCKFQTYLSWFYLNAAFISFWISFLFALVRSEVAPGAAGVAGMVSKEGALQARRGGWGPCSSLWDPGPVSTACSASLSSPLKWA